MLHATFPPSHRLSILRFGEGRSLGVVCGALCGTPRLWFLRGLLACAYPQLRTHRIHLITGHFVSFGQSIACVREWHHPAVDSPMVRTPSAGTAPASCARNSAYALELRAMPDSAVDSHFIGKLTLRQNSHAQTSINTAETMRYEHFNSNPTSRTGTSRRI